MSIHICYGPRMEETHRELFGVRWCFACRKRQEFEYVVRSPIEPSYWDPTHSIICAGCGQVDGDVGFGGCREWS